MIHTPTLIVIAGPTAIGKTDLAIALAKQLKAEIISCDSRQFFREMSIGTAKPDSEQLARVPHHFINNKSIEEHYNSGQFEKDVDDFLASYFKTKQVAIMVGGSGLYIDAVLHGLNEFPEVPSDIRDLIFHTFTQQGLPYLQKELKEKDPVYYEQVDQQNPARLSRALEVCMTTNKPYSDYLKAHEKKHNYNIALFALDMDRDKLYQRINTRVDIMIEQGLVEEVKSLYDYRYHNAMRTVGYVEIVDYLDEACTIDESIDKIKQHTRNYAKRQLTWFRKNKNYHWINADEHALTSILNILQHEQTH